MMDTGGSWKIRVRKPRDPHRETMGRIVELQSKFMDTNQRRYAVEAFDVATADKVPVDRWPTFVVLGKYIRCYERRYCREVRGGSSVVATWYRDVVSLVNREGSEDAVRAIDAVFGEKLRWVDNQLGFIVNKNTYARFVIPAMHATEATRRPRGEQAEWSGDRHEEGAEEVKW